MVSPVAATILRRSSPASRRLRFAPGSHGSGASFCHHDNVRARRSRSSAACVSTRLSISRTA